MNLKAIFEKKDKKTKIEKENIPTSNDENIVADISNWYSDRYGSVLIQRNILFILLVASLLIVVLAVFKVSSVASLYTVKPFVIEIEDKTGITNIVNPNARRDLTVNEALNQYFIMTYIRSREGYCDTDYMYNYQTVVKLLSTPQAYSSFTSFIRNDPRSPITLYGKFNCTTIQLRSIQFFYDVDKETKVPKNTASVRFTVVNVGDGTPVKIHRIASLEYRYEQMELTSEDRNVNPLGFQIVNYRVDDETLQK